MIWARVSGSKAPRRLGHLQPLVVSPQKVQGSGWGSMPPGRRAPRSASIQVWYPGFLRLCAADTDPAGEPRERLTQARRGEHLGVPR